MECNYMFSFHVGQRDRFRDGRLIHDWRQRYPQLFDADDERVLNTEHQRQHHFFEWLSAVLLFEATGYLSLVEKYTARSHPQKRARLQEVLAPNIFDWLCNNESGQPDLFVYEPTTKDWFFCEVKGGADRIRENQDDWMKRFAAFLRKEGITTKGRTRILCLQKVDA